MWFSQKGLPEPLGRELIDVLKVFLQQRVPQGEGCGGVQALAQESRGVHSQARVLNTIHNALNAWHLLLGLAYDED